MFGQSAAASIAPTLYVAPVSGSGGNVVIEIGDYRYHIFKDVGTSTFSLNKATSVDYLVVGGGGRAGAADTNPKKGGGGAGGVLSGSQDISGGIYSITVGAKTQNSQISSSAFIKLAYGEASGDGGGLNTTGYTAPYPAQGKNGGNGISNASAGGGGANEVGGNPRSSAYGGNGGNGFYVPWTVALTGSISYNPSQDYYAGVPAGWYGGGGAGAGWNGVGGELGDAGLGGGGRAEIPYGQNAGEGYNNTGGGGRGGWTSIGLPICDGGSGVVIIRYKYQ